MEIVARISRAQCPENLSATERPQNRCDTAIHCGIRLREHPIAATTAERIWTGRVAQDVTLTLLLASRSELLSQVLTMFPNFPAHIEGIITIFTSFIHKLAHIHTQPAGQVILIYICSRPRNLGIIPHNKLESFIAARLADAYHQG